LLRCFLIPFVKRICRKCGSQSDDIKTDNVVILQEPGIQRSFAVCIYDVGVLDQPLDEDIHPQILYYKYTTRRPSLRTILTSREPTFLLDMIGGLSAALLPSFYR